MISAPRSASCSVPHGPAPNCSTEMIRTSLERQRHAITRGASRRLTRGILSLRGVRAIDGDVVCPDSYLRVAPVASRPAASCPASSAPSRAVRSRDEELQVLAHLPAAPSSSPPAIAFVIADAARGSPVKAGAEAGRARPSAAPRRPAALRSEQPVAAALDQGRWNRSSGRTRRAYRGGRLASPRRSWPREGGGRSRQRGRGAALERLERARDAIRRAASAAGAPFGRSPIRPFGDETERAGSFTSVPPPDPDRARCSLGRQGGRSRASRPGTMSSRSWSATCS